MMQPLVAYSVSFWEGPGLGPVDDEFWYRGSAFPMLFTAIRKHCFAQVGLERLADHFGTCYSATFAIL